MLDSEPSLPCDVARPSVGTRGKLRRFLWSHRNTVVEMYYIECYRGGVQMKYQVMYYREQGRDNR